LRAYARRTPEIDRVMLAGFVLGLSTRKVGETLLAILGRPISAETVSRVAKTLDAAVAAFHRRPLKNQYTVLMLDGVVLARKTGAGALKRPVLVALGLRGDGKKEIIDFRLASSESAAEWERFLTDLYRRGLSGQGLDMICDGGRPARCLAKRRPASRCSAGGRTRSETFSTRFAKPISPRSNGSAQDHEYRQCPAARSAARLSQSASRPICSAVAVCATTSRPACFRQSRSPASRRSNKTPSSAAFGSQTRHGQWVLSRTGHPWTASCSPSSPTKTSHRASAPLSC
jgi:hypothetical protein